MTHRVPLDALIHDTFTRRSALADSGAVSLAPNTRMLQRCRHCLCFRRFFFRFSNRASHFRPHAQLGTRARHDVYRFVHVITTCRLPSQEISEVPSPGAEIVGRQRFCGAADDVLACMTACVRWVLVYISIQKAKRANLPMVCERDEMARPPSMRCPPQRMSVSLPCS